MTPGSPEWIVRAVLDWAPSIEHGLGMVTYRSRAARDRVIADLRAALTGRGWTVETLESAELSPEEFVRRVAENPARLLIVLDPDLLLFGPENDRSPFWINFQREAITARPGIQLWWFRPLAATRFGQELPDLRRFFLFREDLASAEQASLHAIQAEPPPAPDATAAARARDLLERARKAASATNDKQRVWLELGLPALEAFEKSGLVEEAARALADLRQTIGEPEESLAQPNGGTSQAQAWSTLGDTYNFLFERPGRIPPETLKENAGQLSDRAVDAYRNAIRILEPTEGSAFSDPETLQHVYRHLAWIWINRGCYADAIELLKKQEAVCIGSGNRQGLHRGYGTQAVILKSWGRLDEAMALYRKQEAICQELGDRAGLSITYGNQALILRAWGRLDEAMALHKKEETICQELGDRAGLQASYGNQALILQARGRLEEAMALHKKEETICQELGDRAGLQRSYGNQALILQDWGRLDEALALHQKQEAICRELGDRAGLARSYGNQAVILRDRGRLDEAMELHKKEEAICQEVGDRAGLAYCQWSQGLVHQKKGDRETAKQKLATALQIFTELKMPRERDAVSQALASL